MEKDKTAVTPDLEAFLFHAIDSFNYYKLKHFLSLYTLSMVIKVANLCLEQFSIECWK